MIKKSQEGKWINVLETICPQEYWNTLSKTSLWWKWVGRYIDNRWVGRPEKENQGGRYVGKLKKNCKWVRKKRLRERFR